MVAVCLGLRRGELLGLRWRDVDLDESRLQVVQTLQRVDGALRFQPPKTRHSRRTIPLPVPCTEALRNIESPRTESGSRRGPVGVTTISYSRRRSVRRSSRTITTQLVPDPLGDRDPPARLHDLRHTCVSLLLDAGVPPHVVREIAGHSAIDVTMTIYAHTSLDEKRTALSLLSERLA